MAKCKYMIMLIIVVISLCACGQNHVTNSSSIDYGNAKIIRTVEIDGIKISIADTASNITDAEIQAFAENVLANDDDATAEHYVIFEAGGISD